MKQISRRTLLSKPIYGYSRARSALYALEYSTLSLMSLLLPGARNMNSIPNLKTLLTIRRELNSILHRDADNIVNGVYPLAVLRPEPPLNHVRRIPKIMSDGLSIYLRKKKGKTSEFDPKVRDFLDELPRYYRRNFHYQTNGYLSEVSANLYEHQVEMLFSGTADAMRRLIIPPMRKAFGRGDGKGLTFLEIGAGTGRATRFVRLAFPKAKIVATDLSDPYLKIAQKRLADLSRIDFVQADGARLPFESNHFDAVYSVFLFHELPQDVRIAVLKESSRVVKPGGFVGLVDSLQHNDNPRLNSSLSRFPHDFHEPYYRNYIQHPMPDLMKKAGVKGVHTDQAMFSKVCWGHA